LLRVDGCQLTLVAYFTFGDDRDLTIEIWVIHFFKLMYLSFKEKGKTLWTHTTLVADDRAQAAQRLVNGQSGFQNKFAFISTYMSLELVNRVSVVKKQPFAVRVGAVAATALTSL
jgi:hypothetical protein